VTSIDKLFFIHGENNQSNLEQVRLFTPDKVKYADQLFGAAEVPWPSFPQPTSVFLFPFHTRLRLANGHQIGTKRPHTRTCSCT